MESLFKNQEHILKIKTKVENKDTELFLHYSIINNHQIDENTITIVMTASNRSKQTYFTLKTITNSIYKNLQIIIVDDSDKDPIDIDYLKTQEYPFYIDLIKINRENKGWHNPLVNYNIGFQFIQGNKLIIQNAEVCHIGDVLDFINKNIENDNYYVFDVKASLNYETNEEIYNSDTNSTQIYNKDIYWMWYQSIENNNNYHFLTSLTTKTFKKIQSFSYDYTMGSAYDDNDFLLKIISKHINICNIYNNEYNIGGIHLYHGMSNEIWDTNKESNENLFKMKHETYYNSNIYIDIIEDFERKMNEKQTKKTVITITGIRPDFIRMCAVFKELDNAFNHILIHTGQHYDPLLSDVFFKQLNIRDPDYTLDTGISCKNHFEQLAYLSVEIPKLLEKENIKPDLILFLGDSNSVGVSFPLKKAGYKIGHIEAGMRSYDKRMLEEINRTVCDHCSDILFVYHEDYKEQLKKENITKNVFVVGNTIVEPFLFFKDHIMNTPKQKNMILLDIHRPENFKYINRLKNIFEFANKCIEKYNIPVKMLYFKRLKDEIDNYSLELGKIEMVPLFAYKEYLETVYHCKFIISDSGTGQEEPALLGTPVIVPRDYTERPQSYDNNCSKKICVQDEMNMEEIFKWIELIENGELAINTSWLGAGNASKQIVNNINAFFCNTIYNKNVYY